ncbi:heterodisulfide reductase-related iron-sulfur binding cluster [Escherichia coli]
MSQCCGIAGTYGFKNKNHPTSQAIGAPLFRQIEESGADLVITDCETCKWQIEMSTSLRCEHPITLLARGAGLTDLSMPGKHIAYRAFCERDSTHHVCVATL